MALWWVYYDIAGNVMHAEMDAPENNCRPYEPNDRCGGCQDCLRMQFEHANPNCRHDLEEHPTDWQPPIAQTPPATGTIRTIGGDLHYTEADAELTRQLMASFGNGRRSTDVHFTGTPLSESNPLQEYWERAVREGGVHHAQAVRNFASTVQALWTKYAEASEWVYNRSLHEETMNLIVRSLRSHIFGWSRVQVVVIERRRVANRDGWAVLLRWLHDRIDAIAEEWQFTSDGHVVRRTGTRERTWSQHRSEGSWQIQPAPPLPQPAPREPVNAPMKDFAGSISGQVIGALQYMVRDEAPTPQTSRYLQTMVENWLTNLVLEMRRRRPAPRTPTTEGT